MITRPLVPAFLALLLALALAPDARACGCFTPPDPANPVVQAGERILFAMDGNTIRATIQIQYAGSAADFGWILPLPSVPTLEVTTDELFFALARGTQPSYVVSSRFAQGCEPPQAGSGLDGQGSGSSDPNGPLVLQDSVGPYDYAVLKADDKTAMLDWLKTNRYFVPAGTDDVVAQYIHKGAFFLALRLKSGHATGDIQPVVVTYNSDLPMIPIVLTSVTAQPGMNVWAWVLGGARAIPRNYRHVVLDDAALLWPVSFFGGPGLGGTVSGLPNNYFDVVGKAVKEVPGHHAFVTEFARPMTKAHERIFPAGVYGDLAELAKIADARKYLDYLRTYQYSFSPGMVQILQKYIKQPEGLKDLQGNPASPASYYYNFTFWWSNNPKAFQGFDLSFDAAALTAELESKIVKPMRAVAADFQKSAYLTRLFTRLDPSDMSADPVFSTNPDLPEVSNDHAATMDVMCMPGQWSWTGTLQTEQGFRIGYGMSLQPPNPWPAVPAALRIETLRESGPPVVETDNTKKIAMVLGQTLPEDPGPDGGTGGNPGNKATGGCGIGGGAGSGMGAIGLILALAMLGRRTRRRD